PSALAARPPPPRSLQIGSLRAVSDRRAGLVDGAPRQAVGALVHDVAGVARHLVPRDVVLFDEADQRLPEIAVSHRSLLDVLPTIPAPALVPLVAEAIDEIGAVAVDLDAPAACERAQSHDSAHDLHPLVGGGPFAADELALVHPVDHDRSPAPGAGIPRAGAVRVNAD